jgi:hypothetical protein
VRGVRARGGYLASLEDSEAEEMVRRALLSLPRNVSCRLTVRYVLKANGFWDASPVARRRIIAAIERLCERGEVVLLDRWRRKRGTRFWAVRVVA